MALSDILNVKFWGALAILAAIIWIVNLKIERDAALFENASLSLALQNEQAALNFMQQEKIIAEKTFLTWKEKNEQIERDLASARQKTIQATKGDNTFAVWGAVALPDTVFAERLLQNQVCDDPGPAN